MNVSIFFIFQEDDGRGHLHTRECQYTNEALSCTESVDGKLVQQHCDDTSKHGNNDKTFVLNVMYM